MKVILLKDVAKIGRRFAVVNVPDGYALNMLIPRGLAQTATAENIKKVEARAAKLGAVAEADVESLQAAVTTLSTEPLVVSAEANEQDHLFEAIKPEAIAGAAAERGIMFAADQLEIAAPIKSLGEHEVGLGDGKIVIIVAKK